MKIKIPILFAIFVSLGVLLSACSGVSLPGQATPTPAPVEEIDIQPMVSATGVMVPSQWTRLSMSRPGVVEEILIKEGDFVEQGQVLIQLQGTEDLAAAVAAAEFELTAAQKALDDLDDLVEIKQNEYLKAIALATDQYRDAQYQVDNFTPPQEQIKMTPLEALDKMKDRLDAARLAFEPYKYYPSGNQTRKDLKEKLDEAQADYNAAVKRVQYENELAVAWWKLEKARKDFETWRNGPDPKEVNFAKARLANAQAALTAAKAALDDLVLTAPFSGVISQLDLRIGEWVTPGQPILILADLEHLEVETTDLNEIDVARIQVGSRATVTFDALPGVVVQGVVDSIAPKSSPGSGVNYKVIILLDEIPAPLRWGMTAFVDIEAK